MADIWITSDLHFFHKRIAEFCPATRPWSRVEEMNEALITAWNSSVKTQDTIYFLGDLSFGKAEETEAILDRLNGRKYLVTGNHDHVLDGRLGREYFAHKSPLLEHTISGHKIVMCHFPMLSWNRSHYGSLHAYGHEHGADVGARGRAVDVGWDAHGKILHIEEFIQLALAKDPQQHHGRTFKEQQ